MDETVNFIINGENIIKNGNFKLNNGYKYRIIEKNNKVVIPNESYFIIGG